MRRYCKAYHLSDLRRFQGWQEAADSLSDRSSDTLVYLWDDYTVATSPIHHNSVIFAHDTPEWRAFCAETLRFAIPADIQPAPVAGETAH